MGSHVAVYKPRKSGKVECACALRYVCWGKKEPKKNANYAHKWHGHSLDMWMLYLGF